MQAIFENTLNTGYLTVVVLGTGGTIAGTAASAQDVLGYTSAQLGVEALLGSVVGLSQLPCRLEAEQVAQVDSKDMEMAILQTLVGRIGYHLQRDEVKGVVVTHGTDTMEETAFFLQEVLPPALLASKAVVLTCAMRPATATDADGPRNLLDALRLASGDTRLISKASSVAEEQSVPDLTGVVVICAGIVHSPQHMQKVHPTRLDPFDSGDASILGRMGSEGVYQPMRRPVPDSVLGVGAEQARAGLIVWPQVGAWPRVEIVLSHAGADGAAVDALLVQNQLKPNPVRGFVVAGTGNGSIHQSLLMALQQAQAQGVRVVRCSRCAFGSVQAVAGHALPDISGLSPVKARIRLMLDLIQADTDADKTSA